MKRVFINFCVPLMLINNNVYTFLSGVIVSLAINVFSTLCIEKITINIGWHLYIAFAFFLVSGALFIYVATKIASYQNYIISKQIIDANEKKGIVMDFEIKNATKWFVTFISLIITTVGGCVLLLVNYIL